MYPKLNLSHKLLGLSFLIVALGVVFAGNYLSSLTVRSQNKAPDIKLTNKTSSLMIIGSEVDRSDETITHVLLKNVGNKAINGFYITEGPQSKGDSSFSQVEFLYSDIKDEISPGEVFDFKASAARLIEEDGLILHAVFFKDGSAEGEIKYIREVQDIRQGQKVQLERGIQLIDELLSSPNKEFSLNLENIRQKLSGSTKEQLITKNYDSGLSPGKALLKREFDAFQKSFYANPAEIRDELLKIKAKWERVVSNL